MVGLVGEIGLVVLICTSRMYPTYHVSTGPPIWASHTHYSTSCHFCRISNLYGDPRIRCRIFILQIRTVANHLDVPGRTHEYHKSGDANHIHFCRIQCPTRRSMVLGYRRCKRNPLRRFTAVLQRKKHKLEP